MNSMLSLLLVRLDEISEVSPTLFEPCLWQLKTSLLLFVILTDFGCRFVVKFWF